MNAKLELQTALANYPDLKIICARGQLKDKSFIYLKEGFDQSEFEKFLNQLDYEYNRYEEFFISGVVWFDNGWLKRGFSLAGIEWEYGTTPIIPEECKK
mgnify:CR=1 FL=1